jgi:hypothetical protein
MNGTKLYAGTDHAKHAKRAKERLEMDAKIKLNPSKDQRVKSLHDARPRIESLEAELKEAGVEFTRPEIKTLAAARDYIGEPETRLKPTPAEVAPLAKPTVKLPAEIKNLVASKSSPSTLATFEAIQAEIFAAATGLDRIKSLAKHSESYLSAAAKARAERNYTKEAELLKARQRLETRKAYELHAADKETRRAIELQSRIPDL